jgi:hypothetical protein
MKASDLSLLPLNVVGCCPARDPAIYLWVASLCPVGGPPPGSPCGYPPLGGPSPGGPRGSLFLEGPGRASAVLMARFAPVITSA